MKKIVKKLVKKATKKTKVVKKVKAKTKVKVKAKTKKEKAVLPPEVLKQIKEARDYVAEKKAELKKAQSDEKKAVKKISVLEKKAEELEIKSQEFSDKAEELRYEIQDLEDNSVDLYDIESELDIAEEDLEDLLEIEPSYFMPKGLLPRVFKKVYTKGPSGYKHEGRIVEMEIPAKAKRNQELTDEFKCRASEAKVLSITDLNGKPVKDRVYSGHDMSFEYKVGAVVKPVNGFAETKNACASGIHFFMTRPQAVDY